MGGSHFEDDRGCSSSRRTNDLGEISLDDILGDLLSLGAAFALDNGQWCQVREILVAVLMAIVRNKAAFHLQSINEVSGCISTSHIHMFVYKLHPGGMD